MWPEPLYKKGKKRKEPWYSSGSLLGLMFLTKYFLLGVAEIAAPHAPPCYRPHPTPLRALSRASLLVSACSGMSAVQCFDCTFQKNFFIIFLDRLVGDGLSASSHGIVVTMSFALPHLVAIGATGLVQKWGLHPAVKFVLQIRFVLAMLALVLLSMFFSWWLACAFILGNRVASECICRLFPLVMSDLTDEDMYLQQRGKSMSGSIVGSVNLFSKPSQSLAPILGFYLLSEKFATTDLFASSGGDTVSLATKLQISQVVAMVPLLCTALEWLLWRKYTLHGTYLSEVKAFVRPLDILGGSASV